MSRIRLRRTRLRSIQLPNTNKSQRYTPNRSVYAALLDANFGEDLVKSSEKESQKKKEAHRLCVRNLSEEFYKRSIYDLPYPLISNKKGSCGGMI